MNEGQPEEDTHVVIPKTDTENWLILNKLSHLIDVFANENITIDELMGMDQNTLNNVLDDLVTDASILSFKNRDKIRIQSKLKPKQKCTQNSIQLRQIIITESERVAIKNLNDALENLKQEQKTIKNAINALDKESVQHQTAINASFGSIITGIINRRNVLLERVNDIVRKHKPADALDPS